MVGQFFKPKSKCFLRETAVNWIAFFVHFSMLYVVYSLKNYEDFAYTKAPCRKGPPEDPTPILKK